MHALQYFFVDQIKLRNEHLTPPNMQMCFLMCYIKCLCQHLHVHVYMYTVYNCLNLLIEHATAYKGKQLAVIRGA